MDILGGLVLTLIFVGINWLLYKARKKQGFVKQERYYDLKPAGADFSIQDKTSSVTLEEADAKEVAFSEVDTSPASNGHTTDEAYVAKQMADEVKFCSKCGNKRGEGQAFCGNCGQKF